MDKIKAELDQIQNKLIGTKIIKTVTDGESFGFIVEDEKGNRQRIWVDCDAEGNGPGHLNFDLTADD